MPAPGAPVPTFGPYYLQFFSRKKIAAGVLRALKSWLEHNHVILVHKIQDIRIERQIPGADAAPHDAWPAATQDRAIRRGRDEYEIIGIDKLQQYLDSGWTIIAELGRGRIAVRRDHNVRAALCKMN